jgi:hypothetical protein
LGVCHWRLVPACIGDSDATSSADYSGQRAAAFKSEFDFDTESNAGAHFNPESNASVHHTPQSKFGTDVDAKFDTDTRSKPGSGSNSDNPRARRRIRPRPLDRSWTCDTRARQRSYVQPVVSDTT